MPGAPNVASCYSNMLASIHLKGLTSSQPRLRSLATDLQPPSWTAPCVPPPSQHVQQRALAWRPRVTPAEKAETAAKMGSKNGAK